MSNFWRRVEAEESGKIPPPSPEEERRWHKRVRQRWSRDIPRSIHEMAIIASIDFASRPAACSRPDLREIQTMRRRMREAGL